MELQSASSPSGIQAARPPLLHTLWGLLRFTSFTLVVAAIVSALLMQSGLTTEVLGRLLPPAPLHPGKFVRAHVLALPQSPFLEAGRRKDGSIDPWLLEARFHAAGLTQSQALDIVTHLPDLSPVIVAVQDPVFEDELRSQASQAAALLQNRYPDAFAKLSRPIRPGEEFQTAQWLDFQTLLILQGQSSTPEVIPHPNPQAFSAAIATLQASVEAAGLRALRIPPANDTSPSSLLLLAMHIDAANEALQKATGWKGGVLGLNGRVELLVGTPPGGTDQGYTRSARTTGRLVITGRHNTLAHEWMHALDFVLAREALSAPSHGTLSEQDDWLRSKRSPAIIHAWENARQALETAAPHWVSARQKQALRQLSPYWLNHSEEMAFAFQAHVARQSPMLALPASLERYNILYPYAYPTPQELDRQDQAWAQLFSRLPARDLVRPSP